MSVQPPGEPGPAPEPENEDDRGPDSDQLRDLLKRSAQVAPPAPKQDLLRGVQSKIRTRSQGKFYADGWATREDNPRGTYLITAAVMLVLLLIVYWALVPGGVGAVPLVTNASRASSVELPHAANLDAVGGLTPLSR